MTTKDITIDIKQGVEASPVAKCVQVASQFESKIYVEYETKKVNAKSIMAVMSLGVKKGNEVIITAEGEDEEDAIAEIQKVLEENL